MSSPSTPARDCAQQHAPLSAERRLRHAAQRASSEASPAVGAAAADTRSQHAAHEHADEADCALHARNASRRALQLAFALTCAMMLAELAGGWWTGSLMLLSDAAHMASHALALALAYAAAELARRAAGGRAHFGYYRIEILGALLNGIGVLAFTAWIGWATWQRLQSPVEVQGAQTTAIAALGLVVNLLTAWILARGGARDLNTRGALLHLLADTLSSVAVVLGGLVLWMTGWNAIDPLLSVLVALLVLHWSYGLLREALGVLLELAPRGIDAAEVRAAIQQSSARVLDVHDVHVWEITSGYVCMTAHLVVGDVALSELDALRASVRALLEERFGIGHATLELECRG
jgi:cobalt-zinc-cadmium efflux system protein